MARLTGKDRLLNLVMYFVLITVFTLFYAILASAATMPSSDVVDVLTENIDRPVRIDVDGSGKLYVSDTNNNSVRVYANNGVLLLVIEGLDKPVGVGVGSTGNIYIGEKTHGCVSVYDSAGGFLFKLGSGDGEFMMPSDIAVSLAGRVYVTDSKKQLVGVYDTNGNDLFSFGSGQLSFPTGIAVDEGAQELYVVNHNYKSISIYDMAGHYLRQIRGGGGMMGGGSLHAPQGIAVDDTRVYIADSYNSAIAVYDKNGIFLGYIGEYGKNIGEMRIPLDTSFDSDGKLFITNNNNGRLEVLGLDNYTIMTLDPAVINATVYENSAPFAQSVSVSSNQNVTWSTHETGAWLSVDPANGATPGQLGITVNPLGLGTGSYREIVTVTNRNGTDYAVVVNLDVTPRPREFSVSPSSIELTLQKKSPDLPEAEIILSSRNGAVSWTGTTDTGWLALNRSDGSTPDSIKALITNAAREFDEGIYAGRITFEGGDDVIGSPAIVDVTLKVIEAGTLKVLTNHPDASFTITGSFEYSGSGSEWVYDEMKPGTYTITFDHISGFDRPRTKTFSIETGKETVVKAVYTKRKPATHIVAAAASLNGKKVAILTLEGVEVLSFEPFISAERLHVATGDVNGDGIDEIVVSDMNRRIKIYSFNAEKIGSKELPFGVSLTGMAVGDVDNDGVDEVLLATIQDQRISSANGGTSSSKIKVFGYIADTLEDEGAVFETEGRQEMKIAVGDMDGNETAELIIADNRKIEAIDMESGVITFLSDTLEYNAVPEISTGDLNDDGMDEVVIGASLNNGTSMPVDDAAVVKVIGNEYGPEPFVDQNARKTLFVSVADIDGDNIDEIAAASGVGEIGQGLIRLIENDLTFGGVSIAPNTGGSGVSIAFGVFE